MIRMKQILQGNCRIVELVCSLRIHIGISVVQFLQSSGNIIDFSRNSQVVCCQNMPISAELVFGLV